MAPGGEIPFGSADMGTHSQKKKTEAVSSSLFDLFGERVFFQFLPFCVEILVEIFLSCKRSTCFISLKSVIAGLGFLLATGMETIYLGELDFNEERCLGGDFSSSHGNLRAPPPPNATFPPENKALLRDY